MVGNFSLNFHTIVPKEYFDQNESGYELYIEPFIYGGFGKLMISLAYLAIAIFIKNSIAVMSLKISPK